MKVNLLNRYVICGGHGKVKNFRYDGCRECHKKYLHQKLPKELPTTILRLYAEEFGRRIQKGHGSIFSGKVLKELIKLTKDSLKILESLKK